MRKVLAFVMVFMFIPAVAFGNTTKVLDQDTVLRPQGWTSGGLSFKQGTTVELNDQGQVISGILKGRGNGWYELRPAGAAFVADRDIAPIYSWYIDYVPAGQVIFEEHGWVLSGTIEANTDAYLIPNVEPLVRFKENTVLTFDRNRNVLSGTLCKDTLLCPAGWEKILTKSSGIMKFKAGTEVAFGPNAQVIKGTIAEDLTVNGTTYPAGTTLLFSESGYPQKVQ